MQSFSGNLRKMRTEHQETVQYVLPVGDALVPMNEVIGTPIRIEYAGQINCVACGRQSKKSFQQGYCFPCMRSLPECDNCIVRPETCHFHEGTCRDAQWGEQHCMQDHFLYLANTSGLKVGITRGTQVPTRWMDQGAVQALPIARAKDRLTVGKLEVALKQNVSDRTQWQRMLKGAPETIDLKVEAARLLEGAVASAGQVDGWEAIAEEVREFHYPVDIYPEKVKSFNLDKTPIVDGQLNGIKGQYLLLDSGVINIRKFGGYHVEVSLP